MSSLSDVHKLLGELVRLPSINPSLSPNRTDLTGEGRVGAFLAERAEKNGISVEQMPVFRERKNLILRICPSGKTKHRVFLTPHMDVVPAEEKDFIPRVRNGMMFGRGTCDTKGSVAAFFQAFMQLARHGPIPRNTEILFVGLVDEEYAQAGSRKFAEEGPGGDLAIAGEPTNLKVVSAHKGSLWMRITTKGRAAHGSTPQIGRNAIEGMNPILQTLANEYPHLLSNKKHKLLGSPTVSVGRISGGTQPNVVPDHCELDIDRRIIPGETEDSVIDELSDLLRKQKITIPDISISRSAPCPPLDTNPNLPFVRLFLKSVGRRKTYGVPYFTDASPLAAAGIPALVYGPGSIAQAHAKNEWVSLKEVSDATSAIVNFLQSLP